MNVCAFVACASCTALLAFGQSMSIGGAGLNPSDNGATVLAPPPVKLSAELQMAELPLSATPPQFFLNYGTSGRYGPYALADGTLIGSKQAPYTLRMFDYGLHFTLQQANVTNSPLYGPFPATNGAPVILGKTVFTVVRFPPRLHVTVDHPNKISQAPQAGIAPYSNTLLRDLYALRAKYAGLANRVDTESADVELEGVPRIRSASGNTFSPVIKRSNRDKQNSSKTAELSAITFLESLFAQAFTIRPMAITEGPTYQFGMPPGDYVFCCLQKVKDPHSQGVTGATTAIWWTTFHFDGERPLSLSLTAENAISWRQIFPFDQNR